MQWWIWWIHWKFRGIFHEVLKIIHSCRFYCVPFISDIANCISSIILHVRFALKSNACFFVSAKPVPANQNVKYALRWRHNGHDSVSNHQPHDCLFNRLFRRRPKKTLKLRVIGLCAGNSQGTGEFPAQMASNAENVSICWRPHASVSIVLSK